MTPEIFLLNKILKNIPFKFDSSWRLLDKDWSSGEPVENETVNWISIDKTYYLQLTERFIVNIFTYDRLTDSYQKIASIKL